jgi:tetratricopeptide (TPR) repeat protein/predicted Ser/Thr protein kinase
MNTVKMEPPMPAKCPQCGTPLPAGALAGLCPACLLRAGAAADTVSEPKPAFNPPTVAELSAKFPQLEILELIGKGGMGAVYKARQRQLDRFVALKILPPGIGDDPAFAERFAREARALARLNHPGIVTIYDFGRADGLFYFFMEFVDGVNLRQLLHGGRVSPREALAIVPQICDALQFAHDQGIVHRDIKPENILLDRRGRVKVADFGLAKIMAGQGGEPAPAAPGAAPGPLLTESGKIMGTPQYMAPEQKEHPDAVDHRADIYALGVVFYQMLTGELPGTKIEPPSSKVQIDVRLDEVVLRALERKPELRYQQASVLKTQVETIVQTPAGQAATPGPGKVPGSGATVKVVLGVAIGVAAAVFLIAFLGLLAGVAIPNFIRAREHSQQLAAQQWTEQGWQLWQSGKLSEAETQFQKAVQLAPDNANAWNGLGWVQFNAGNSAAAEASFQKAVVLETNQPGALNGLGQIYLSQRKFDAAEKYLLRAAPQAPAAWFGLTRLYLLQGKFAQAEKWAEQIVDSGQADDTVQKLLAAAKAGKLSDSLRAVLEPPPAIRGGGLSSGNSQGGSPAVLPVEVAKAFRGDIGARIQALGTVAPPNNPTSSPPVHEGSPAVVFFSIVQDDVQSVVKSLDAGKKLGVEVSGRDGKLLGTGVLVGVDNEIDPQNGTLKCRASVQPGPDVLLFPNQFVNVRLQLETKHGVTLIPFTALQVAASGSSVMVLDPAGHASKRLVTQGVVDDGLVEITEGLSPGEIVITTPNSNVEEGATVAYHLMGDHPSASANLPEKSILLVRATNQLAGANSNATPSPGGSAETWSPTLVATGHQAEAEKPPGQAVALLDDPRLKSSISDAQEKIQKPKPASDSENDANLLLAEQPPVVVETFPPAGAQDVAPGETEIRVRFSKPMSDRSWSWSTAWDNSGPEFIGVPHYLDDHRTCVVKVRLEAGKTYGWWLNSQEFKNFRDRAGQPAVPYLFSFQTRTN